MSSPRRARASLSVFVAVVAAALQIAGAAPAVADDNTKAAREHVLEAQRLERKKDYAGAVRELELALELRPDAKTQLALATNMHRDGRIEQAYAAVRKVAGLAPDKATAKAAQELETSLEAQLGTFLVVVEPDGAVVSIDGVVLGTTPLPSRVYKTPGPHVVRIEKPGYVPVEQTIEVAVASTPPVDVKLAPAPVAIAVRSEPPVPDAVVVVDGEERGPLPWSGTVMPGEHQIGAVGQSHVFAPRTVQVAVSSEPLDEIVLAASVRKLRLQVAVTPKNAAIWIDQTLSGAGEVAVELPIGPHLVRAEAVGYQPEQHVVELRDDQRLPLTLRPVSPPPADVPVEQPGTGSSSKVFAELSAVGLFTAAGDPVFDCSRPEVASCDGNGGPHGAGFDMHFGYQPSGRSGFGIDVELMLLSIAAGMQRDVALRRSTDSVEFVSPLAVIGAGPRYTTSGRGIRGTIAVDLAAALRGYIDASSQESQVGDVRFAPAMSISMGGIVGAESGAHLAFGVRSFVELPRRSELQRTAKGAPVSFGSTTTVTVGPYVGVSFGP